VKLIRPLSVRNLCAHEAVAIGITRAVTERSDYEGRIARLLALDATLNNWLQLIGGLAKDAEDRTILIGLTARETEEFLELNVMVRAQRDHPRDLQRYLALRSKHETARQGAPRA
jgi:hypothetical protein